MRPDLPVAGQHRLGQCVSRVRLVSVRVLPLPGETHDLLENLRTPAGRSFARGQMDAVTLGYHDCGTRHLARGNRSARPARTAPTAGGVVGRTRRDGAVARPATTAVASSA